MLSVANKPIMLSVITPNVIMPNVIMPNVIMLSVIILNVVVPFYSYNIDYLEASIKTHFDMT
jgi:hypothetical protein